MTDRRSAFSAFRVKKETIKLLQDIKQAYELTCGNELTNDEFIHEMVESIHKGDAAVWEVYEKMQAAHQELAEFAAESRKNREE